MNDLVEKSFIADLLGANYLSQENWGAQLKSLQSMMGMKQRINMLSMIMAMGSALANKSNTFNQQKETDVCHALGCPHHFTFAN